MEIARAIVVTGPSHGGWSCLSGEPQHLVPLANKPILFHNLDELRAAGVLEAVIMCPPESEPSIRRAVGDGSAWKLAVRYATAPAVPALADVLDATRDFVADEPVLVEAADMLLRERMRTHVTTFAGAGLDALALHPGGLDTDPGGYLLSRRAVSLLASTPPGVIDPLVRLRRRGGSVRVQEVDGCRPCRGGHDALLDGNRRMLERLRARVPASALVGSRVQGAVVVHPTARLERTLVRGPAIIGAGARLTDAYVGPYTSVGNGVVIEGSEIEHSIVLEEAELRFVGIRLESSVIGRGARVTRSFELPTALRLAIGDRADVAVA